MRFVVWSDFDNSCFHGSIGNKFYYFKCYLWNPILKKDYETYWISCNNWPGSS
jgi:hypothetical protein